MSVDTTYGKPEQMKLEPRERQALTDVEASKILGVSMEGKNLRNANVVLIFEHGRLRVANVYKKVA